MAGATGLADQEVVPGAASDAAWVAGRLSAHLAALDPGDEAPRAYFARILERVAAEYQAAVPQHRDLPAYVLPSHDCAATHSGLRADPGAVPGASTLAA